VFTCNFHSISMGFEQGLLYCLISIFWNDTDIIDKTEYVRKWYPICKYDEMKQPINGRYCRFRYENPMADTNTEISSHGLSFNLNFTYSCRHAIAIIISPPRRQCCILIFWSNLGVANPVNHIIFFQFTFYKIFPWNIRWFQLMSPSGTHFCNWYLVVYTLSLFFFHTMAFNLFFWLLRSKYISLTLILSLVIW